MNVAVDLKKFLYKQNADESLIDLIPEFDQLLPANARFEEDSWNVLEWSSRKGTRKIMNINFGNIKNDNLKILSKIYILEKRLSKRIKGRSALALIPNIERLDKVIGIRAINKLTNADFERTERLIVSEVKASAAPRNANFLKDFGIWLNSNLGIHISYEPSLTSVYLHGRKATDAQRDNKLVDSRIVMDLVAANRRDDLIPKDKFYLPAFTILVGTGFRIIEWSTLPKDCIIKEDGRVGIRFFPAKTPKLDIRWLPSEWSTVVEDAIEKIIEQTNSGREAVANLRKSPGLDWSEIVKDKEAVQYFVGKFCHEWTSNPLHDMFYKYGAWLEKEQRYIDVIKLLKDFGTQVEVAKQTGLSRSTVAFLIKAQEAALSNQLPPKARDGGNLVRTDWDTDSRVISIVQLENSINLKVNSKFRSYFNHILIDARDNYQLKGKIYPCPAYNIKFEEKFRRVINAVVETDDNKPLLQPEDALFITTKYQLTESRGTQSNDYKLITEKDLSRWFCGEKRSLGSKNAEDSCFSRLDIIDPKTNEIAKFVPHDIRHWLTTYYLEGGMPSDQVALLFNRTPSQNDTYDQTSSRTRLNNMREAIRSGGAIGHVSDNYHQIAEYSREDAEKYLEACTLQLNLMPHGGCSLNWGMKACDNHNGCFNGQNGLCEHLCIDPNDVESQKEIALMARETATALQIIPEQSPQYTHYKNIERNLKTLIVNAHD